MGNKRVPTSDRKWNERFRQKIMEDYERREDEKERKLAEAEVQRVLQLKLQGIVPADDGHRDAHDAHGRRRRGKKSRAERKFERRMQRNNEAMYRQPVNTDLESQMEILHRDESERRYQRTRHDDSSSTRSSSDDERDENSDDEKSDDERSERASTTSDRSSMSHKDEDDVTEEEMRARRTRAERKHHNAELDKLYEEESLDSLYREAEKLIYISSSTSNPKTKN